MKPVQNSPNLGYYRFPTIHNNTIVFTAEGDLWRVDAAGGIAQRLTTHHGLESHPAISPDGETLAFSAQYEGPTEVYSMPLIGGRPTRHTYEGESALVVGWTPDAQILYTTQHYATLPNMQLATVDPESGAHALIPLHQASGGTITPDGKRLFFTRLPFQGSHAKRYKGGSVENIWTFPLSKRKKKREAIPLTGDYLGTSKAPMFWEGRIYFASDRDGTMNLWSMAWDEKEGESDLQQHTHHSGWDIKSPALHQGRIVYQSAADIYLYNIAEAHTKLVPITLASDFDQSRERWVRDPFRYLNDWSISPTGDRIALTARGRIFVFPAKQGRRVEVTRTHGVHYRNATFLPDGKSLVALSDESGELEFWTFPANGVGEGTPITDNGNVFRYGATPSPDGKKIAFDDKHHDLWITDLETKESTRIATSDYGEFYYLRWSPDSRWLAYTANAANGYLQIWLYSLTGDTHIPATSDRVDSMYPAWSPDGKWLYFLSHRHFESLVSSPWGQRQPEPYFEQTQKIYLLALQEGLRSPFQPSDELDKAESKEEKDEGNNGNGKAEEDAKKVVEVKIELEGLTDRIFEVPLPSKNYWGLSVTEKHLYWLERSSGKQPKNHLKSIKIENQDLEVETILSNVRGYQLSSDGKKLLVRKENRFYVCEAKGEAPKKLEKQRVPLSGWRFAIEPREEWRQMLTEAWRLQRDYFYDPKLHNVDWQAQLERHLPLVERLRDRDELDDLIAHLIGELAALHTGLRGGDKRNSSEYVSIASLGARLTPTDDGLRIEQIYRSDPDYPDERGPLERPDLGIREGDIIQAINGVEVGTVDHPQLLLKDQVGKQVLLRVQAGKVKSKAKAEAEAKELIVEPISSYQESQLRYGAWEYQRRLRVEEKGKGEIGYVHLRAMSGENYTEWVKNFYPVFNRNGLIVDVRHNRGGNIDSWILEKLLRRAWFFWQPRVGKPYWNMQLAFRGHMVVLCNERTASDGETLTEGFRRLGLGKIIGTRTWGGGIWLSPNTPLVDKGLARTAQIGVFTPEGEWAIEGHGVEPDIVVDNLPHATFNGNDAQLDAAIKHLQTLLKQDPIPEIQAPPYPDKSFEYK